MELPRAFDNVCKASNILSASSYIQILPLILLQVFLKALVTETFKERLFSQKSWLYPQGALSIKTVLSVVLEPSIKV